MHTPLRILVLLVAAQFLAACGGGGGGGGSSPPPPPPPPAPTINLTTSTPSVPLGSTASLSWSTTNASSCTASGGWSGSRPTSGTESIPNLTVRTTFVLECTNAGVTASATITIEVRPVAAPTITFDATPLLTRRGQPVTLTWSTTDATDCSGSWAGSPGPVPTTGSAQVDTSNFLVGGRITVGLNCNGPGGNATATRAFDVAVLAGTLVTPLGVFADTDINDPDAPYLSNDTTAGAIPIPDFGWTPGYVNVPGGGPAGRSQVAGDVSDYYRVSASMTDVVVRLTLPTVDESAPVGARDDADLYLYDSLGTLVDASVGNGRTESLLLRSSNNWIVEVRAAKGGMNYLLTTEDPVATTSLAAERVSAAFVPGEAIVAFAGDRNASAAAAARAAESGYVALAGSPGREQRVALPFGDRARARIASTSDTRVPLALQDRLATLLQLKALRARSDVRSADLNRIVRADALQPTDPLYARQRWHYELANLPVAWDTSTGSNAVVVAVVDSGVVTAHPDLAPKLEPGYDFVSDAAGLDGNGLDADPSDPGFDAGGRWIFHGTHVAGTIGAAANNGVGGAGVAWNARVMPIRVLDGRDGTTYDVLQGVRYAAGLANDSGRVPARRADVINLSLGDDAACSTTEADVFRQVAQAGVHVVASGGNTPSSAARSPARCPGVVSVGAATAAGTRASYSAFGNAIALLAPGGDMNVDVNADGFPDGVYSTHATRSGTAVLPSYDFLQGTSMAAPHFAGIVALMKSVKPSLTPTEVESFIEAGLLTNDLGRPGFDEDGWGLVDAQKALQAASGTAPSAPIVRLDPVALDFGNIFDELTFEVRNTGVGLLTVNGTTATVPWATVTAANVNSAGLGIYRVRVSRVDLARGFHAGAVEVSTSAGVRSIPFSVAKLPYNVQPRPGRVYLRLLDAESGRVVYTAKFDPTLENQAFRLFDAPLGRITLIVGTDLNNDGNLCDVGELCGVYPGGSVPDPVTYSGVLDELALRLSLVTAR